MGEGDIWDTEIAVTKDKWSGEGLVGGEKKTKVVHG